MSAQEKAGFELFQTIGDISAGVEIFIKDSPAIRRAIIKGAADPEMVAGVLAAADAVKAWVWHLNAGASTVPAPPAPAVTVPQVIDVLQNPPVRPDPAGPGNPQI